MAEQTGPRRIDQEHAAQPDSGMSINVESVYLNTKQRVIVITEDRAEICLRDHYEMLRRERDWQTPAAFLITLIVTLVTTQFHDFLIPKDAWFAAFVIAAIVAALWLARTLMYLRKRTTVRDILSAMKQGAIIDNQTPQVLR